MTQRATVAAIAGACAAIDIAHKVNVHAEYHHVRSPYAALAMGAFVVALVALVPRFPSRTANVGAGIAAGGALGNLLSVLVWSQGVPDPIVWQGATHGVAFNLADLFALLGDALLLCGVAVHALRHRPELRAPV
ncbi:MAG: signal peptidase II [Gaiellaceae bacterium]